MDSILKSIREFFKKLTRREQIRLVVLAIFIIALSVAASLILGRVAYEYIEISRPENIVGLEKMIDMDAGTVAQYHSPRRRR